MPIQSDFLLGLGILCLLSKKVTGPYFPFAVVVELSEHFEWFHGESALKQKIGANLAKQRLMLLVRMLLRFIPWFITASVILLSKVYFSLTLVC